LRQALSEIGELLVEVRGLMVHPVQHRRNIISKITKAEGIATSTLKPVKAAIVNLPIKQVA
jgi:hypothetical protein